MCFVFSEETKNQNNIHRIFFRNFLFSTCSQISFQISHLILSIWIYFLLFLFENYFLLIFYFDFFSFFVGKYFFRDTIHYRTDNKKLIHVYKFCFSFSSSIDSYTNTHSRLAFSSWNRWFCDYRENRLVCFIFACRYGTLRKRLLICLNLFV